MAQARRGRSIGVSVYIGGKRKWIGSVTEKCERCDGKPKMCAACDAKATLRAVEMEERAKRALVYKSESCEDFASRWLADYGDGGRWDESTLRNYRLVVAGFAEHFGAKPLRSLDPSDARRWAKGKPRAYLNCVRAMLNDALRDELIDRNPFSNLRLDAEKGRSQIVAITEDELHLLCEIAREEHGKKQGPVVAAMIAVAGYTAIRPGELYALEPADLRADACEMNVRWQYNGHELKRPKSKKPRTVALPPQTAPFLADLPSYLGGVRLERVLNGKREAVEHRPLFRNSHGRPWQQSAFHHTWAPIRSIFEAKLAPARRAELRDARDGEKMDFYELRHFGCTEILRRGGTLDDAAHQLGHADTKLVAQTYGHLEESYKVERVKRLYETNVKPLRAVDDDTKEATG